MASMKNPDVENTLRWDHSTRGHYEVYYLTFNHIESGCGFWIRYTLNSPEEGKGDPYAQIWFSFFDHAEPEASFGVKKKFPIAELATTAGPFSFAIGDNKLKTGHAVGAVKSGGRDITWDLTYTTDTPVHYHLPSIFYKKDIADTTVLCPALEARFSGAITIDGRKLDFENDPGCQTHLWGEKHAQRWAWGHCSAFDGHPDSVFEGLSVQIKKAGFILPVVNLIYVKHDGVEYDFTELDSVLSAKGDFETGDWKFSGVKGNRKIEGRVTCSPQQLVRADYFDPDGDPSWCHNTEVARAEITISKRSGIFGSWKEVETLVSEKAAHVEFAGRKLDSRVKKHIEEID